MYQKEYTRQDYGRKTSEGEARYERADDNLARLIVYFGPYLLWGTLGALVGGLILMI